MVFFHKYRTKLQIGFIMVWNKRCIFCISAHIY